MLSPLLNACFNRQFSPSSPPYRPASGCCFTLVARYSARLADISEGVAAHPLELLTAPNYQVQLATASLNNPGSSPSGEDDTLPLFGPICFRLSARPDSVQKPVRRGLLWIRVGLLASFS